MNAGTRPVSIIAFISTILIITAVYAATKYISMDPDFLERVYVNSGEEFYISLVKPSGDDYTWEMEYDRKYAKLLDKKSIIPFNGSLGGLKTRQVYKFKSLDNGIIYIIANYPNLLASKDGIETSKIFEIRMK